MGHISNDLTAEEYLALAEFRLQIRRFLHFSEQAAQRMGLESRQHQLLLSLKALSLQGEVRIGDLAEHLQRRHHSIVGLIDRLEEHRLVHRARSQTDKRQVYVQLTGKGEEILHRLSLDHRAELQAAGPALVRSLDGLIRQDGVGSQSGGSN
jgi:DNA-binding MarR family transcriptional regulator